MSATLLELSELPVLSEADVPLSSGGGPSGWPCAPRAPPGPLAKAFLKTSCSSAAWSLVNLPLDTSPAIRPSIFDFMASGDGRVPEDWSLARLDCSELSMSASAEARASWLLELILPADTS